MADMIRDLFVRLGVVIPPNAGHRVAELDREIRKVVRGMEMMAGAALRAGTMAAAFAVAAGTAIGKLAIETGVHSLAIERQAQLLLLSREEYQKWLFVVGRFGATQADLADSFLQINDATQRALSGSKEMTETFATLGINVQTLRGKNPAEIFDILATQIEKATDRAAAMGAISRLLGEESARKLGPALMQGADAIRALKDEAVELGLILSNEQMDASKAANAQWLKVTGTLRGLRLELGAELSPMVERLLRGFLTWIKANRELMSQRITYWVQLLSEAIRVVEAQVRAIGGWDSVFAAVATGAGLAMLFLNITKILHTIQLIQLALPVLAEGMVLAAGFFAPFLPGIIIVSGLAGALFLLYLVLDDIYYFFTGGKSVIGGWFDLIGSYFPMFAAWIEMWGAVKDLVVANIANLWLFAKAAMTGLFPALAGLNSAFDLMIVSLKWIGSFFDTWLNEWAIGKMKEVTAFLTVRQSDNDYAATQTAVDIKRNVSNASQGWVSGMGDWWNGNIPRYTETNNTSMNNNTFNGVTNQTAVEQAIQSTNRQAATSLAGKKR